MCGWTFNGDEVLKDSTSQSVEGLSLQHAEAFLAPSTPAKACRRQVNLDFAEKIYGKNQFQFSSASSSIIEAITCRYNFISPLGAKLVVKSPVPG